MSFEVYINGICLLYASVDTDSSGYCAIRLGIGSRNIGWDADPYSCSLVVDDRPRWEHYDPEWGEHYHLGTK